MGGQACVLYGAAEFSKDIDLVLLLEEENLRFFKLFLSDIQADVIAVPPYDSEYLLKGHAIHFRAQAQGFEQLRIDVMSKLRGVDPFSDLWNRRSTAELLPGLEVNLLSLPDLVSAKKTQRDKDWPMIRRLVDVDYLRFRTGATSQQALFWLRELRTPELLIECASNWPDEAQEVQAHRSEVIYGALHASRSMTQQALSDEEKQIREEDRHYWQPLMRELEVLRRNKGK
jgi:hypothetical protein